MAERRTLLSQVSKDAPALQPGAVRAPDGAFGDYSGMRSFGNDLAQVGGEVYDANQRDRAKREREMKELKEKADRLARQAIEARYSEAVLNANTAVAQEINDATVQGEDSGHPLVGTPRTEYIEKRSDTFQRTIDEHMKIMQDRYPELYGQVVTPEVRGESWARAKHGHVVSGFGYSRDVMNEENVATTQNLNSYAMTAAQGTPEATFQTSTDLQSALYENTTLRSPQRQAEHERLKRVTRGNYSAQLGNPALPGILQKAMKNGTLDADDGASLLASHKAVLKQAGTPDGPAFRALNGHINSMRGGSPQDAQELNSVVGHAAAVSDDEKDAYNRVVMPTTVAKTVGRAYRSVLDGFPSGGTRSNIEQTYTKLSAGLKDKEVQEYVVSRLKQSVDDLMDLPEYAKANIESMSGNFGDKEVNETYAALLDAAKWQNDQIESGHGAVVFQNHPDVQKAMESKNYGEYIAVMRRIYAEQNITDPRKIDLSYPDQVFDIRDTFRNDSPQAVEEGFAKIKKYQRGLGDYAKPGLISISATGATGIPEVDGVIGQLAQISSSVAVDPEIGVAESKRLLAAASAVRSPQFKAMMEKYPAEFNKARLVLRDALSNMYLDKASVKDPKNAEDHFLTSPLGRILIADGNLNNVMASWEADVFVLAFGPTAAGAADIGDRAIVDAVKQNLKVVATFYNATRLNGTNSDKPLYGNLPFHSMRRVNNWEQDSPDEYRNFEQNSEAFPATIEGAFLAEISGHDGPLDSGFFLSGFRALHDIDREIAMNLSGSWWQDAWHYSNASNAATRYWKPSAQAKRFGVDLFAGINLDKLHVIKKGGGTVPLGTASYVPRDSEGRVRVSVLDYFRIGNPRDDAMLALTKNYVIRYNDETQMVEFYVAPGSVNAESMGSVKGVGFATPVYWTNAKGESVHLQIPYKTLIRTTNQNRAFSQHRQLKMEDSDLQKALDKQLRDQPRHPILNR